MPRTSSGGVSRGCLGEVDEPAAAETTRRVVDPDGDLVALIGWEEAAAAWRILRVFNRSR